MEGFRCNIKLIVSAFDLKNIRDTNKICNLMEKLSTEDEVISELKLCANYLQARQFRSNSYEELRRAFVVKEFPLYLEQFARIHRPRVCDFAIAFTFA